MPAARTVLIADDDAFNREGIRLYLSRQKFKVVEAGDEQSAWELAAGKPLDAAVVDISMPAQPGARVQSGGEGAGIRLAKRMKQEMPAVGLVLFSAHEDRGSEVLEMLRTGVRGLAYKLKGCPPSALLATIEEVIAGRVIIDPEVHANQRGLADELLKRLTPDERYWVDLAAGRLRELTPKEREISHRLAASHNTEGIARAVGVTTKTAENYIGQLYDKLGLNEMGREAPHLRKVLVLAKVCMIDDLRTQTE
jgi:DNA-binding NarL/FixJ family response regulator